MREFQGMIFKWIRIYKETFKSALVYHERNKEATYITKKA